MSSPVPERPVPAFETLRYKPASKITSWDGWPEDVTPLMRDWNRMKLLTFMRIEVMGEYKLFKCTGCAEWHRPPGNGVAVYRDRAYCDGCLIVVARALIANDSGQSRIEGGYS